MIVDSGKACLHFLEEGTGSWGVAMAKFSRQYSQHSDVVPFFSEVLLQLIDSG
jgi:hypothetical protein